LHRAIIMGNEAIIEPADLGFPDFPPPDMPQGSTMKEVEAWHIGGVLKRVDGNLTRAAAILGLNRDTVARKIKDYGLGKSEE
jgi:DNA-binding NtrC family response regulator